MKEIKQYVFLKNDRAALPPELCDFKGNRELLTKQRKHNFKYHLYEKKTGNKVMFPDKEPMSILHVEELSEERLVFYVDARQTLSFVRTKQRNLSLEQILDKIEKTPFFRNGIMLLFFHLFFFGVMRFRSYQFSDAQFSLGYDKTINHKIHFLFPKKIREKFAMKTGKFSLLMHSYWAFIPLRDIYHHYLETSDINTPVYIKLKHDKINYIYNMKSDSNHKYDQAHYLFNTRSVRLRKEQAEIFIRKSVSGQYVIVNTNVMNRFILLKEKVAYLLGMLSRNREKYDVYFEKFSAGASESAFEVFKTAYQNGDDCVYILDKNHPDFVQLKETYGKSLVAKNSLQAFYAIFLGKSFISSDLVSHLQRRLYDNDALIKKKILSNNNKIFLQHGVCLATNVFERGYFNRKVPIAPDYILVNSAFEKSLFLQHSDYSADRLMATGLPNLDLYVEKKEKQKDEITFMLTWRPWDLTGSIEENSYLGRYLSFIQLIEKEPFYHDKKVNVVLHPKSRIILQEQFPDVWEKHQHLFYEGDIKNALLQSKVLISDYSSVVFYAFGGGSNIVFYWEDKERAENEYGARNILQKENCFGDICENFASLHKTIEQNYIQDQPAFYQKQYGFLVEYRDGKNTKRTYNHITKRIFKTTKQITYQKSIS